MSEQGGEIRSVLSLVAAADQKQKDRLLMRTLVLPKNGAEVIEKIEQISAVKDTLPDSMKDVAENAREGFIRSLIGTTSIKGHFLQMVTTSRQHITLNDPRLRKQLGSGLLRSGGGEYE